jgi:predicted glycosyltransferase
MATGPGKYDREATVVREVTDADAVVVIVIGGRQGSGFSVQASLEFAVKLPALLRRIADDIEANIEGGDGHS